MTVSFVNGELFVDGISFNQGTDILNSFINVTTWTPTLSASTTPPDSVTYSVQTGRYIVLGPLVIFGIAIQLSAFTLGSGAGDILITGLPITNTGATSRGGIPAFGNLDLPVFALTTIPQAVQIVYEVPTSTTNVKLVACLNNASPSYVNIDTVGSSTLIQGAGFYFTS